MKADEDPPTDVNFPPDLDPLPSSHGTATTAAAPAALLADDEGSQRPLLQRTAVALPSAADAADPVATPCRCPLHRARRQRLRHRRGLEAAAPPTQRAVAPATSITAA